MKEIKGLSHWWEGKSSKNEIFLCISSRLKLLLCAVKFLSFQPQFNQRNTFFPSFYVVNLSNCFLHHPPYNRNAKKRTQPKISLFRKRKETNCQWSWFFALHIQSAFIGSDAPSSRKIDRNFHSNRCLRKKAHETSLYQNSLFFFFGRVSLFFLFTTQSSLVSRATDWQTRKRKKKKTMWMRRASDSINYFLFLLRGASSEREILFINILAGFFHSWM